MLESENIEFKQELTTNVYKEVIAFSNTSGGIIYIGINDNGNIVELDNVDETYTRITNGIRDSIHPDVTISIKYTLEDYNVIKIEVNERNFKPYYLKSKIFMTPNTFKIILPNMNVSCDEQNTKTTDTEKILNKC